MSGKTDDKGNLHVGAGQSDGGKFDNKKYNESAAAVTGPTGVRRRTADELGIPESILMAPCNQVELYQELHRCLVPYQSAVSRLEYLAKAKAAGDEEAISRLSYGPNLDDALSISGDFFGEAFKILDPEEIAPYWERVTHALEAKDEFELNRALLGASMAEDDAHPIQLDPNWRKPGVHLEDGIYESKKVVGDKQNQLEDYNIATINKHVRNDIEDAKAAGWLPANLEFRVRKADSNSMVILISSIPDDVKHVPHPHYEDRGWTAHHPAVKEIEARLRWITEQYGTFENDSQQDYFNNSFYPTVIFK
jgi:hypothetical protein